ncbi:MAG: cytochrome c-550 PedF [Sphingomonas sp.]|nr:MAG: cytochrome c-550 PedF [Sphingomonas sp.]
MSHRISRPILMLSLVLAAGVAASRLAAQAEVAPQPVDTAALPDIAPGNDKWIIRNPYRDDPAVYATAKRIGERAYEQNCARCHGSGAVSEGIVPDLRHLDAGEAGDQWFITRYHHGLKRDGKVYMPPMGDALGQKAGWAIRSWLDGKRKS